MNDMNHGDAIMNPGTGFGAEAAEHIDQRAEAYSEYERQHIELTNQPRINELRIEAHYLMKRERALEERLACAASAADERRRRNRARYYWLMGASLGLAAFFFSVIAFAPFRLGWWGIAFYVGVALVTPFAVEEFLEAWKSEKVIKAIVTGVFCAALAGGAFLAAIRGDLLAEQVKQSSNPAVVIDGEATPAAQPQETTFYESARPLLRMLMLFLALAIDLGAGIAIHRARVLGAVSGEDPRKIAQELSEVQQRIAAVAHELTALTNAPADFVARFWRDFYRAMITQTARRAAAKFSLFSLLLFLLTGCASKPQDRTNIVAALDLSSSESARGRDGQSAFNKNVAGVEKLLASLPPGSQITVVGITDNSFAMPYVLLSGTISEDQGYFGERLTAARRDLVRVWRDRAGKLKPDARGTDIMGALLLAHQLFARTPTGTAKYLFIFSDMRHVGRGLNLESAHPGSPEVLLKISATRRLMVDLSGVTVYVSGADADGMSAASWDNLQQFWTAYFKRVGANLAGYSLLSEPLSVWP